MKLSKFLFKNRSYTPIPFLILMIIFSRPECVTFSIGILVAVLGESFRFWGVSHIGAESRTTGTVGGSKLLTSGPFAYTRNPLYTGNILIYLGIGIASNALFPYLIIGAFLFFIFQYYFIVIEEEKYLQETFKDLYTDYCKNVNRFLIRITPYISANYSKVKFDFQVGLKSERRTLQGFFFTIIIIISKWIYLTYVK